MFSSMTLRCILRCVGKVEGALNLKGMRDVPLAAGARILRCEVRNDLARPIVERTPATPVVHAVDVEHADAARRLDVSSDPVRVAIPDPHRHAGLRPRALPLHPHKTVSGPHGP